MKLWTLSAAALVTAATVTAAPPAIPQTPVGVQDILFAQPFTIKQGYEYDWSAERPMITSGQIVVFQVNPDLVYPRQTSEPVLYVGSMPAERLNVGYLSGRVVAIVPDSLDPATGKMVPQDLSKAWFGQPLEGKAPDARIVAEEAQLAAKAGVKALSADKVQLARQAGGEVAKLERKHQVLGIAGRLLEQYSPDEVDLIANYAHTATLK